MDYGWCVRVGQEVTPIIDEDGSITTGPEMPEVRFLNFVNSKDSKCEHCGNFKSELIGSKASAWVCISCAVYVGDENAN